MPGGIMKDLNTLMNPIINNWHDNFNEGVVKEILSRLNDYCELLTNSADANNSTYGKRILSELQWAKRSFILPYYRFETNVPSPFHKKELAIYADVRRLRRYLTIVANGIEQGMKKGGAAANAACDGIENPWAAYNFVPANPVSRRLDMLLGSKKKNNSTLILFALAISTVLDFLLNNEGSWAYDPPPPTYIFRKADGARALPQLGIDGKIDVDAIFKQSLKAAKPPSQS
jgi:hypothetical protein